MEQNYDNKHIAISRRYAQALIDAAKEKNEIDKIQNELSSVVEVLKNSADLKTFLENPMVSKSDKTDVLQQIFGGKIEQSLINFLELLIDNRRINTIETTLYCYNQKADEIKNIKRVIVISAVELDEKSKSNLQNKLASKLNAQVELQYEIDNEIIGGLVIKIGDKIIDSSLKTRLESLQKQLV